MRSMVYACVNTFLCHRCWSMHPPPSPNEEMKQRELQKIKTVQCKYPDRHRQAEPYIEKVWPNRINQTVMMRGGWSGTKMETSATVSQINKVSIYDSGIPDKRTNTQTRRQTDRRSSSRFSAYLFFQRACQTVEKHLMQTEKVSESLSHFVSA